MRLVSDRRLCAATGCLAVMAVEAVTDVTIAVVTAPIKVVGGIVDAVTGDDEDSEQED